MATIAWAEADGRVRVARGEPAAPELERRWRAKGLIPKGAAVLVEPVLPDRASRERWRIQGGVIVDDPSVPPPQRTLDRAALDRAIDDLVADAATPSRFKTLALALKKVMG